MKSKSYRLVTGVLLISWMIIIFWFSAQPASESQQMSGSVSYRIMETLNEVFDFEMSVKMMTDWASCIDFPVRKGAHMAEYALCAILVAVWLMGYRTWDKHVATNSFIITVCYAVSDEVHQLFVPGRAGRISDVCIDSVGAAIGLLLFGIILKLWREHCEKKQLLLK